MLALGADAAEHGGFVGSYIYTTYPQLDVFAMAELPADGEREGAFGGKGRDLGMIFVYDV